MSFHPVPKPTPRPKRERKAPKAKNVARRADEFTRCYGSEERVAWVQALPCVVEGCRRAPCDNSHITGGGMGRKADADQIVPLCRVHHKRLDEHPEGREGFEGECYVDLAALALDTERCWRRYAGNG